jgi:predicted ribosomally synthesized peptide with nif11-like leader
MAKPLIKKLDKDGIRKLTSLKTKEEILAFAKAKGFEVSDKDIEAILKMSAQGGDLSPEELDKVSGGYFKLYYDANGVMYSIWYDDDK